MKKRKNALKELGFYIAVLVLLAVAAFNLTLYLSSKKVLGAHTNDLSATQAPNQEFWISFLKKNPDYIPGQIEMGNLSAVKKIDPNYIIP